MERFSNYFKSIFVIFFGVFILDLLWRYASLMVFFDFRQIIQGIAGTVFGVFLFSGALAAFFFLLEKTLGLFLKQRFGQYIVQTIAAILLSLLLYVVLFTSIYRWINSWQSVSAVDFQKASILLVVPFLLVIIWFRKKVLEAFFQSVPYHYYKISLFLFLILVSIGTIFKIGELIGPRDITSVSKKNMAVPNVIFITVDALTAEHMSLYGYGRNTTPRINKFAEESFVFERMHSNGAATISSLASIFLSKYPQQHGATYPARPIPAGLKSKNIIYLLKEKFAPITIVNSFPLGRFFNVFGLLEPFKEVRPILTEISIMEHYGWYDIIFYNYLGVRTWLMEMMNDYFINRYFVALGTLTEYKPAIRNVTASSIFDSAAKLNWGTNSPVFLWLHVYAPHEAGKYAAPPPFERKLSPNQLLADRYDELLLYTDYYFGKFVDFLKNNKMYDNTIIILTADHGFQDKASLKPLSETKIHIPLIIHLPGQKKGKRLSTLAEQVDLAPTILDLLSMPAPKWMEGESLAKYFKGGITSKPKYSTNGTMVAAYKGDYKLIYDLEKGEVLLYNLKNDPKEKQDLSKIKLKMVAYMKKLIASKIKTINRKLISESKKRLN